VVNLPLIEVVLVACLQPSEVLACTLTAAISSQLQEDALVTAAAHRMDVFSDLVVSCPSGKTSLADVRPQALESAGTVVFLFHEVEAFDDVLESEICDGM
jgi:hypothetical protein